MSAIHVAAQYGRTEVVREILRQADIGDIRSEATKTKKDDEVSRFYFWLNKHCFLPMLYSLGKTLACITIKNIPNLNKIVFGVLKTM